jgi:hypothetical protein
LRQNYDRCARTIVLIGYEIEVPPEIEHLTARCVLDLPDRNERRQLVEEGIRQWAVNRSQAVKIDNRA